MKASDFRDATFSQISGRLSGLRALVYAGLLQHGPCTTATLAAKTEISLWNIRPRMCELLQLGLARLEQRETLRDLKGREGVYAAVPLDDLKAALEAEMQRRHGAAQQMEMRMTA
jgi:sugar-specific transcriptional regulator TrmB